MILLGIVYGAVTGNMQAVTDAVFASAKEAVTLCITMTGMMALWVGVMEIARGAGLIRKWSEKLKPFIHFLFPGIPKGHKAQEYIAANMIANILGLGSAATPAGLKAMEELAEIKKEKGLPEEVASNEKPNAFPFWFILMHAARRRKLCEMIVAQEIILMPPSSP